MGMTKPDALARLRAANPVRVEADRGCTADAQATLERILSDAATRERPRRRLWARLPRGGVGVALALAVAGGGAAIAATNPFGWWSTTPGTANYAVNSAVHVRTPTAAEIGCRPELRGRFTCAAGGSGQRYTRFDTIRLSGEGALFTRAGLNRAITWEQAHHRISGAQAARLRQALARVPATFFAELQVASRYQSIGGGSGSVPPPGVPDFLVCQGTGTVVSCENLNGDNHAPIGAGVYIGEPGPGWRPAPARSEMGVSPPGIQFTRSEARLLIDILRAGLTVHASSARQPPFQPLGPADAHSGK